MQHEHASDHCAEQRYDDVTRTYRFTAMASPCELQIRSSQAQAHAVDAAAQAAVAEVRRIETKYSRYRADSVVSRINSAAGTSSVAVDEETLALLQFAQALHTQSGGLFDITSGVLRRAWRFGSSATTLPRQTDIAALLPLVRGDALRIHANHTVALPVKGMEIDLGGIGKEYAADRAAAVLSAHGFHHALVNLGGDIHALGPVQQAQGNTPPVPWHITVAAPPSPVHALHPPSPPIGIPLLRGGLATSGDYERFIEHAGRRYCHVLNPLTGWPAHHWQSITVLAANTTSAGALTTVAMLMQADAPAWLNAQGVTWMGVLTTGEQVFGGGVQAAASPLHF
jgi:thiamine biosynthesis lipoprotein